MPIPRFIDEFVSSVRFRTKGGIGYDEAALRS